MMIKPFYELCRDMDVFIKFNANVNKKIIPVVGYELHCCDPQCDCRLTTIMMNNSDTKKHLTTIQYGWDDYDYYIKEKFVKSDVDQFIKGCLIMLENSNSINLSILASFHNWLEQDLKSKKKLFAERYKQCKLAAKNKGFSSQQANDLFLENMDSMLKLGIFDDLIVNKFKDS